MKTIFLIDVSNLVHRAFYAMGDICSPTGFPTGAVYGYLSMLHNLHSNHNMRYVAACLDVHGSSSTRRDIYPEYKANRTSGDADRIGPQMKIVVSLMNDMGIPVFGIPGYEADDLIGTIAKKIKHDNQVIIVSGDKDLSVLVEEDRVFLLDTMKHIKYTPKMVVDKWGVRPEQISDYLALTGDTSDNIPGAYGIGPVAAKTLMKAFDSVEDIYANIDKVDKKYQKKLIESTDRVLMSKKLTTIMTDAPIGDIDAVLEPIRPKNLERPKKILGLLGFSEKNIDGMLLWCRDCEG